MSNMRTFSFKVATGVTQTSIQFIGANLKVMLVASAMTNWNAGSGNASMTIRGAVSETDSTTADIVSNTISTMAIKGFYPMANQCPPYICIGFGTATTGALTTPSTIDVIVYRDSAGD